MTTSATRLTLTCGPLLLLAACAAPKQEARDIRVGMTKAELVRTIGQPLDRRGPAPGRNDRLEEVWTYRLEADADTGKAVTVGVLTSGVGFFDDVGDDGRCEFVFAGDRLVRWGRDAGSPAAPR